MFAGFPKLKLAAPELFKPNMLEDPAGLLSGWLNRFAAGFSAPPLDAAPNMPPDAGARPGGLVFAPPNNGF